ncbi:MAG TPA: ATP-binding protein [Rectinemataceae bacterium]|nr:ATP-binding protein [Rectinemataceae bacterium]
MLLVSLAVSLPELAAGFFLSRLVLSEQAQSRIHFASAAIDQNFSEWIDSCRNEARFIFGLGDLRRAAVSPEASAWLSRLVERRHWIRRAYLISRPGGRIVATSDQQSLGHFLDLSEVYTKGQAGFAATKVYSSPLDLAPTMSFSAPLGSALVVCLDLRLDRLETYRSAAADLGKGASIYLVDANGNPVSSRAIGEAGHPRGLGSLAIDSLSREESGSGRYRDYRGRPVLGDWRWMPGSGLGIVAEMDESEALKPASILGLLFLLIASVSAFLSWLIASRLSASLVRPIEELTRAAAQVGTARGVGICAEWPEAGADEVGILNRALRDMTAALERDALELESRVLERTAELDESNVRLQSANEDLRRAIGELGETRKHLVDSEKMAVLGTLVAGISHELNTPLGAILSSARSLGDFGSSVVIEAVGKSLETAGLPAELVPSRQATLYSLLRGLPGAELAAGGAERRRAVRTLAASLDSGGVPGGLAFADELYDCGIRSLDEGLASLLSTSEGRDLAHLAWKVASMDRSVRIIGQAAERASRVIVALRVYSHQSRDGEPETVDLRREMDLLLDIYYGSYKNGIEVTRDYREIKPLACHRDRLNQVWANLISNAVQAMGGSGRLRVLIADEDTSVRVEVGDDGPGIPPEDRSRIFTPFFTTKGQGEGTGLGLSISKDIVEEHGGSIDFTSEAGRTVFVVRLPYRHSH